MAQENDEDGEEYMDKEEEVAVAMEVVQEVAVHIKMEFTYHLSTVTLKMNISPQSKTKPERE